MCRCWSGCTVFHWGAITLLNMTTALLQLIWYDQARVRQSLVTSSSPSKPKELDYWNGCLLQKEVLINIRIKENLIYYYAKNGTYSSDHFVIHFGNFIHIIFSNLRFSVVAKLNLTDKNHRSFILCPSSACTQPDPFSIKQPEILTKVFMVAESQANMRRDSSCRLKWLKLLVLLLVSSRENGCSGSSMGRHIHGTTNLDAWAGEILFFIRLIDWHFNIFLSRSCKEKRHEHC